MFLQSLTENFLWEKSIRLLHVFHRLHRIPGGLEEVDSGSLISP